MVIYILVYKKFINLSFDYGVLRCLDFSHILQSLYQLYALYTHKCLNTIKVMAVEQVL